MMGTPLATLLALALAPAASGQDNPAAPPPKSDALEWAVALSGRFKQLQEPVTAAYAFQQLGAAVCPVDQAAGAGLFREALGRLSLLTPPSFVAPARVLPVPSFTALWNSAVPAAVKCSSDLDQYADADRARAKMDFERRNANATLRRAFSLIQPNPDRAAQLAQAAMTASDPNLLDISMLARFLSELRERAPDVTGDVFADALDFVTSARYPSPSALMELGKYLFVSPGRFSEPDKDHAFESFTVGQTTVVDLSRVRESANSDDVHDYIDSGLKVLTATDDPYYDPVAAYAVVFQMLPKARELAPDLVDKLTDALTQLTALAGGGAAQVQAKLGGGAAADPGGGESARARTAMTQRVLGIIGSKNFVAAREALQSVDDMAVRGQVGALIDFAESAEALARRDTPWAYSLANTLRPGIKRSLLYAALVAAAPNLEAALGPYQLAFKDIEVLPPEQQLFTLAALAAPMLKLDPDNGYVALSQLVAASNAIYTRPRRSLFDPKVVRRIFSGKASAGTDSALILFDRRGAREYVDTGRGRHSFALKAAGIDALTLAATLRGADHADRARLESIVLGLRSETELVNALIAMASARLNSASAAPPR